MTFEPQDLGSVLRILELKKVLRKGWTRYPIPRQRIESVADHSYGVAILSLLFCPPTLNRTRVLEMALIHDLAEVETGDLTPDDGVDTDTKQFEERLALQEMLRSFRGATYCSDLLKEYQDALTPEARWLKTVDKLEMSLQSLLYEDEFPVELSEFRRSSKDALSELGLSWLSREKNDPV